MSGVLPGGNAGAVLIAGSGEYRLFAEGVGEVLRRPAPRDAWSAEEAEEMLGSLAAVPGAAALSASTGIIQVAAQEVTEPEREALRGAVGRQWPGVTLWVMDEVLAAARGAGQDVDRTQGQMVVLMGSRTTDIAVISAGDVVLSRSLRLGTDNLDDEITKYVRAQYGTDIGATTARQIRTGGSLARDAGERPLTVNGKDAVSGLPKSIQVTPEEVREVLRSPYARLVDLAVQVLEDNPSELAGDIMRNGLVLAGPHPRGADRMLTDILQLPVRTADSRDPVLDGARAFLKAPRQPAQ
ncbi:rod shape-determining protein [Streptomyces sp. NPDC050516]|uniref:rod shape-determining protein n=1 Tax=Streptomyces sp. NPDC050516 TaxID=3365621 RepID=UPI0037A7FA5A